MLVIVLSLIFSDQVLDVRVGHCHQSLHWSSDHCLIWVRSQALVLKRLPAKSAKCRRAIELVECKPTGGVLIISRSQFNIVPASLISIFGIGRAETTDTMSLLRWEKPAMLGRTSISYDSAGVTPLESLTTKNVSQTNKPFKFFSRASGQGKNVSLMPTLYVTVHKRYTETELYALQTTDDSLFEALKHYSTNNAFYHIVVTTQGVDHTFHEKAKLGKQTLAISSIVTINLFRLVVPRTLRRRTRPFDWPL